MPFRTTLSHTRQDVSRTAVEDSKDKIFSSLEFLYLDHSQAVDLFLKKDIKIRSQDGREFTGICHVITSVRDPGESSRFDRLKILMNIGDDGRGHPEEFAASEIANIVVVD